jgi:isopenicillin N synthase-like dioxygenase
MESIPVINVSSISLENKNVNDEDLQKVGLALSSALATWGFAYLSNHGVQENTVENCFKQSQQFFALPQNIKEKHS